MLFSRFSDYLLPRKVFTYKDMDLGLFLLKDCSVFPKRFLTLNK